MPIAAPRFCATSGCANRQPCALHGRKAKQQRWDDARGTSSERGYGQQWAKFRSWWFDEAIRLNVPRAGLCGVIHPGGPVTRDSQCKAQGQIVAAKVLDHARPVTGPDDPLFFDPLALQGLCRDCDQKKRQREATASRAGR